MHQSKKTQYFTGPWIDSLVLSGGGSLLFLCFLYYWQSTNFQYANLIFEPFRNFISIVSPTYLPASSSPEATASALLVTFFFYISIMVNYPHYSATYFRLFRNPKQWAYYKRPFQISTFIVLILYGLTFLNPAIVGGILVTLFMLWSPYHYTGQNFGVGMIQLRNFNIQLSRNERRWVYAIFYSPWVFHFIWTNSYIYNAGYDIYALKVHNFMQLTAPFVVLGKSIAVMGLALLVAFIIYMYGYRKVRLPLGFIIVAVIQFVWWWFLYLVIMAGPDVLNKTIVITLMIGALPFFHCAQYLLITTHFEAREKPILNGGIKHLLVYYTTLVFVGVILFQVLFRVHHSVTGINIIYAEGIFMALINLHHFMVDGFIWKIRQPNVASNL